MIPQDRQLLAELARVNSQVPGFVLSFIDGKLSPDEQSAFARKLADLAAAILDHADERKRMVIDGHAETVPDVPHQLPSARVS